MEADCSDNLLFLTGVYSRVARRLGVHPSYVSRVARGERRSERVYRAVAAELSILRGPTLARTGDDAETKASHFAATQELRRKFAGKIKSDSSLRRLGTVIVEENGSVAPVKIRRISAASLSGKMANNSRLIAAAITAFERFSRKLERFPHVLSLLDANAVVLYSAGTTDKIRRQCWVPGADCSQNHHNPCAAARSLTAGVPVAVIGAFSLGDNLAPSLQFACPVQLSNDVIAGVLLLTIGVTRARLEHVIELTKVAKRLCKFVENVR